MAPDEDTCLGRREALGGATAGVTVLVAGCSMYDLPLLDVPRLTDAWLSLRENGDAAFVLRFDGDIQRAIEWSNLEREDLISAAADHDATLEFTHVELEYDEPRQRGERTVPEEHLVQGRFVDVVKTADSPIGPRFSTPLVTYEGKLPDEEITSLTLYFPNGYRYRLPDAHRRRSTYPLQVYDDGNEAPEIFDYSGESPDRTFPFVRHVSNPELVGMRGTAEYRFKAISDIYKLFDQEWYIENSFKAIRQGIAEIAEEITKEAGMTFLTHPLPDTITAPFDIHSAHSAIQGEYSDFRSALDQLELAAESIHNISWLNELIPPDDESSGLVRLAVLSKAEYEYRNPLLVSAAADEFEERFQQYRRILEDQRTITRRLSDPTGDLRTARVLENEYWRNLHDLAVQLVTEFDSMVEASHRTLDRLEAELL